MITPYDFVQELKSSNLFLKLRKKSTFEEWQVWMVTLKDFFQRHRQMSEINTKSFYFFNFREAPQLTL